MLIAVLRTLRSTYHLYLLSSFFFTPPATTEIYTLSLHDALPISAAHLDRAPGPRPGLDARVGRGRRVPPRREPRRSEERRVGKEWRSRCRPSHSNKKRPSNISSITWKAYPHVMSYMRIETLARCA